MKLVYRGLPYESNSQAIETTESDMSAQYRGSSYQVRHSNSQLGVQHKVSLKFRGASYQQF
jgi:Domain of unknown function (DUF4278)